MHSAAPPACTMSTAVAASAFGLLLALSAHREAGCLAFSPRSARHPSERSWALHANVGTDYLASLSTHVDNSLGGAEALPSSTPSFKLDPAETALVLIEYQNEFTTDGGKLHDAVKDCMASNSMLEKSASLMNAMRSKGCLVFHVPIIFNEGHAEIGACSGILAGIKEGGTFTSGTFGAAFHPSMAPDPGRDLVVQGKLGLDGFFSTNLDFLLRQRGMKNIVLGGFLTNCCVESTMRTAYEHGYDVYTLEDCTAATSVEAHAAAFEHSFGMFSTTTNSEEVKAAVLS